LSSLFARGCAGGAPVAVVSLAIVDGLEQLDHLGRREAGARGARREGDGPKPNAASETASTWV